MAGLQPDDKLQQFFEQHHIEDNMFESFEEAEAFFKDQGFAVDKEAAPEYEHSTVLPYLYASATEEQLMGLGNAGKIHAVWRLKALQ